MTDTPKCIGPNRCKDIDVPPMYEYHPLTDEMLEDLFDYEPWLSDKSETQFTKDDMRGAWSMGASAVFTNLWVANAKRDPEKGDAIGIGDRVVYFKEGRWYTAIMKCKPHEVSPTFYTTKRRLVPLSERNND